MEEKRLRPRKKLGFTTLGVVLAVLLAALFGLAWWPITHARAEWRAGRVAEAIQQANRWSGLRIWGNQYHELLAAFHLSVGNRPAANEHLAALQGKKLWVSALTKQEVANRLFARSRYEDFIAYDKAVQKRFSDEELTLYRAAAYAATNRITLADDELRKVDRDDVPADKLQALERTIAQRKEGNYPFIVDRDGRTIATYLPSNRDVVAVNTDFAALIEKEAGQYTIEGRAEGLAASGTIELTLSSEVQKAAVSALGGFRGSLVAIDARTNELLAVATSRGGGPLADLALGYQYEPGSAIKVITGLSAFSNGLNVDSLFPYTCGGHLPIDGRQFGDWLEGGHGVLPDFDEALARSCNVVFADLGVRLGRDRLKETMTKAGFDGQTDLGLFTVPLGRTVGQIFNKFETAFYAIGIEHASATTLHMAMFASMMANRGVLTPPRLVRSRRSILGEVLDQHTAKPGARVVDRAVAERLVKAMTAVVMRDTGTGRRADIEGVSLALKTGTAGEEAKGYHAVIVGFAPVESPRIAFAVFAEDAGPAEFAGAKIAHDFLSGVRDRLR